MDFGLSEDQVMFQEALRGYLAERLPTERVRVAMESDTGRDDEAVAGIAEQGVTGVLVPENYGGTGLGLLDAAVAAEELGRAAAPFSFHSAAVMAPLLLAAATRPEPKDRWLPEIAAGRIVATVVTEPVSLADGKIDGRARFVADAETAELIVVAAADASGAIEVFALPRDTPGISVEPLATVDDTRRVGNVVFDGVTPGEDAALALEDAAATLGRAIDAGRVMLAADAIGSAERSLELAVAYSLDRKQFGRAIGSFQAVKHMCAEVIADIEPVRSLLWYAAFAHDDGAEDASYAAALLKSHATEVATSATTTCVQVFGGMGFTYECDMHLWFKRAGYDRQMLGTPTALREQAATVAFG